MEESSVWTSFFVPTMCISLSSAAMSRHHGAELQDFFGLLKQQILHGSDDGEGMCDEQEALEKGCVHLPAQLFTLLCLVSSKHIEGLKKPLQNP